VTGEPLRVMVMVEAAGKSVNACSEAAGSLLSWYLTRRVQYANAVLTLGVGASTRW
jgi:hypothetical protein